MKKTITYKDLLMLMDHAKSFYLKAPSKGRLPGMDRPMSPGELQALSILDGALTLLNIETVDIILNIPDSHTIYEE